MMEITGYEEDSDWIKIKVLKKTEINCSLYELEKILAFFRETINEYKDFEYVKEMGVWSDHYRDWDKTWTKESSDILITMDFEGDKD